LINFSVYYDFLRFIFMFFGFDRFLQS